MSTRRKDSSPTENTRSHQCSHSCGPSCNLFHKLDSPLVRRIDRKHKSDHIVHILWVTQLLNRAQFQDENKFWRISHSSCQQSLWSTCSSLYLHEFRCPHRCLFPGKPVQDSQDKASIPAHSGLLGSKLLPRDCTDAQIECSLLRLGQVFPFSNAERTILPNQFQILPQNYDTTKKKMSILQFTSH